MNEPPIPFETAMSLAKQIGKERAAKYFRAVLNELEEPEEPPEKGAYLDEDEIETLENILEKLRAANA